MGRARVAPNFVAPFIQLPGRSAQVDLNDFVHRTRRRPAVCRPSPRKKSTTVTATSTGGDETGGKRHSAASNTITRFALISDVHVFDEEGIWREDVTDFNLQRLVGLANLVFFRGPGKYNKAILRAALEDMKSQGVEHLVVAGDITNLAMESEFALAQTIFQKFGPDSSMTFCPGNHDVYVSSQGKAALFNSYFGRYCLSDVPTRSPRGDGFPFLQVRGGVAFIGLNTGQPNTASGKAGSAQWSAASDMLRSPDARSLLEGARFRVLVQHHPVQNPSVRGTPLHRQIGHGFHDWAKLREFTAEHSIDLAVHGHLHVPYRARLDGCPETLVYESGSGTLVTDDPSRTARYTIFELGDPSGTMGEQSVNSVSELTRTFARVWDFERECFQTLDLSIPKPAER